MCRVITNVGGRIRLQVDQVRIGARAPGNGIAMPSPGGRFAPWQAQRVTAYIDAHLCETIRIEDLAEQVRLSRSHFARVFRVTFGLPPHRYVVRRRIEHAKLAMARENPALSEVALSFGFSDQSHFSRTFQRLVGASPSQWLREAGLRR
jgi:AraC family transcriptional regulator